MFGLIGYLWGKAFERPSYQVLLVGLDNAGKTSCAEQVRIVYDEGDRRRTMPTIAPTIGFNLVRVDIAGSDVVLWDVGGQAGLRIIWNKYYSECHAIVYVIDAAAPERFEEARKELSALLDHEDVADAPLLVLANKQDLPDAKSATEVEQILTLEADRPMKVADVIALTGTGIKPAFDWLVAQLPESKRAARLAATRTRSS
ncbi:ADP-ribosylation factor family [Plasmodiophora brassicae]|uniref:Uncharacterized protein n=2 Tax=Plasmodiophora brassicae TaxID=37360 RepID=A0A3P3XYZ9_PLABS|nr:unnamed protein product [Plasmodiophora brassicae]